MSLQSQSAILVWLHTVLATHSTNPQVHGSTLKGQLPGSGLFICTSRIKATTIILYFKMLVKIIIIIPLIISLAWLLFLLVLHTSSDIFFSRYEHM